MSGLCFSWLQSTCGFSFSRISGIACSADHAAARGKVSAGGRTPTARPGFTLIELLVVVAIIAILAAFLYGSFVTAKASSLTTKCQAHQKELAAALLMYADDYGGRLPFIQFLSYTDWQGRAAGRPDLRVTRLYQPYVKNFDIILCPALMAFAYNQCLYAPAPASPNITHSNMEIAYDSNPAHRCGRLLSQVAAASRTPAFFCAKRMAGKNGQRITPDGLPDNGWGWVPTDIRSADYLPNRHNGGANYAFLDGHVAWYAPAGNGFFQPIQGIDYDGNGTTGTDVTMR